MSDVNRSFRFCYFKMCLAGIKEDMAKRIMYSILPSLAPGSQVALTEGVVDYSALKAAVEGRKNIIHYGIRSLSKEIKHYKDQNYLYKFKSFIDNNQLEDAADIAVKCFSASDWDVDFGGKPWEMIAKTVRQLIRLDKQLSIIRKQPKTADNQQKEIQIMKDIVVEMNIFDGLAHNSDDILSDIVRLELEEQETNHKNTRKNLDDKRKYLREVQRIMDAKELDSPTEVYKLIQDTLVGSGDINKFKDWISRLRETSEAFIKDSKTYDKLFLIHIRKKLRFNISTLNQTIDKIENYIQLLSSDWKFNKYEAAVSRLDFIHTELIITKDEINESLKTFYLKYPEITNNNMAITVSAKLIKYLDTINLEVKNNVEILNNSLYDMMNEIPDKNKQLHYLNQIKETVSLCKRFIYALDAV